MPETIITSEAPSTSSQLNQPSRIICRVCQKQFSQYTCPRCNTWYCSLPCYKSHSLRCTESFMRDNVVEELRQLQPGDENKQKMLDILKRFHSEEETDSMDEDGIIDSDSSLSEETIQKVLSGCQISLEDLSAEERRRFRTAVESGELSKLIKPWEPWWIKPFAKFVSLSQNGTRLVQSLHDQDLLQQDDLESDQLHDVPPGPEAPLPSIRKLSSAEPSPLLAVHLIDILYSYCFTLRLYNGDWRSDPVGSAMVLFSVSSVLGQGGQPETVLEALSHCLEQTCSPAFKHMGGSQFGLGLLEDITRILDLESAGLVCLLCDLRRLIQAAEKDLKMEKSQKSKRVEMKNKLKSAERKVYFIMCWVHEQPGEAWSSLATIVRAEINSAKEYEGNRNVTLRTEEKVENKGKLLIKEIE